MKLIEGSAEEAQKLADEENKRNRERVRQAQIEADRLKQARKEGKQPPEGSEKKAMTCWVKQPITPMLKI